MTVLQKMLSEVENKEGSFTISAIKTWIAHYLPAEEQQIRDAYKAGSNNEYGRGAYVKSNPHPDLETYLTHLQTK